MNTGLAADLGAADDRLEHWKEFSELGAQLVVIVPKESEKKMRDLCWNSGLVAKVKIGSFDVDLKI